MSKLVARKKGVKRTVSIGKVAPETAEQVEALVRDQCQEMVTVMDIVRGAPRPGSVLGDRGQIGAVEYVVRHDPPSPGTDRSTLRR